RIVLANPGHELAPGMFANVHIRGALGAAHPLVPTDALVSTGTMSRVILALGDGRFKPVAVRVGAAADGMTAIVAGLHGGERVVTSGQFLIDSEANLSGALQRLSMPAASATTATPKAAASSMSGMAMPSTSNKKESPASASSSMLGMDMPASSASRP
ncbi:MAG: hypothetical protein L0H29_03270, partial [Sinobacteraceae bacterium]|nr:hypothetical protein [Nevskiaceae bacterium]